MRYVYLFGAAILIGILLAFLDISEPLGIVLAIVLLFGLSTNLFVLPIYMGKDVEKLEKFIRERRRNPVFKLYYGIANTLDDDVKEATDTLLRKYKDPSRQAIFKTLHALYEKDILRAKHEIQKIQPVEYKHYYQAIVAIEEGNLEEANELCSSIKSDWMKHALRAGIAEKAKDHEAFKEQIQKAFDKTRGLQRYVLYKQYEQVLRGSNA
ncbi:hypothetical protein ACLM5H_20800 [Fredinandcohnia humi]